jgi:GAF domain-containing protein
MADTNTLKLMREENFRLKDKIKSLHAEVSQLRRIIQVLNTLQHNLDAITHETDVLSLIHNILRSATAAVDCEDGSLLLIDEETEELVFVEVLGKARDKLEGYRLSPGEGIAGWVIENKTPVITDNAALDTRWSPRVDMTVNFQTDSLLCVPLLDGDRPLGVIEVQNPVNREIFREEDLDILLLISRFAAMALVQAEKAAAESNEH